MSDAEPTPTRRRERAEGAVELLPEPASGRVFRGRRRVRLGDVGVDGRVRLDALARYLQDVSGDDSDDADLEDSLYWVVRRTVIEQRAPLRFREWVDLATFCSGYGSRWAERRVSIEGEQGGWAESVTLWVHVDGTSGRPRPLGEQFVALYGEAAGGRQVDGRLRHDALLADSPGVEAMAWRPRVTDLDILDHVNNAIAWAVVEQALAEWAPRLAADGPSPAWATHPFRAEVEYRDPIDRDLVTDGPHPVVLVRASVERLDVTIRAARDGGPVFVTGLVTGAQPRGDSTRA